MEQTSVIKIFLAEKYKQYGVHRNMLWSKNVYKWVRYRFAAINMSWKTVHGVETHWLSDKEKVLSPAVSKEGHADSLHGHKKTPQYSYLPTPLLGQDMTQGQFLSGV